MRMTLVLLLAFAAGCGGGSPAADQGFVVAEDMAKVAATPADLAQLAARDMATADLAQAADLAQVIGDDMTQLASVPDLLPAAMPDLTPACGVLPLCSVDVHYPNGTLCCNAAECINGGCFNTAGEPCSNVTGPVCWNDQSGRATNNGVCGSNGKCQ